MPFDPTQPIKSKAAQEAFRQNILQEGKASLDRLCLFGNVKRSTMGRALENYDQLRHDMQPHVRLWHAVQDFFAGKARG